MPELRLPCCGQEAPVGLLGHKAALLDYRSGRSVLEICITFRHLQGGCGKYLSMTHSRTGYTVRVIRTVRMPFEGKCFCCGQTFNPEYIEKCEKGGLRRCSGCAATFRLEKKDENTKIVPITIHYPAQ